MPLTPLSTPLTTQYKPLGLEAFAVPLSELQKKFDLTQQQLNNTEYSLDHLNADDERSKELMGDLNQTTADLSEALVRTGNFREVANRLGKLNKYYNKNPEIAAIKSNHTAYKTAWAEMDKLRQDEKITATQLKEWENWAKGNFKGTNYDKQTGAYTSGNFRITGPDIRKEMMDEALDMAKMTQETKDAYITRMMDLGVTGEEAQRLAKISLEERNKDVVAQEIANVLKKIPKYSDYLINDAEIRFYNQNESNKKNAFYTNDDPLSFSKDILKNTLSGLTVRKQSLEAVLAQDNLSEANREYLEKDLAELNETIEDTKLGIAGTDPEMTEDLAETFYKAQALGYIDDLSSSTADLVDFVHRDISGIGGSSGVSSETKKKIDQVGNIVTSIDPVTSTSTSKVQEGITSTYIEEANKEVFGEGSIDVPTPNNLNELFLDNEKMRMNSLATETFQLMRDGWGNTWKERTEDTYKYKDADGNKVLPDIYKNGADVAALDFFNKKYDQKIEELDGELIDLNTKLSELDVNSAEYRELSSKIVNTYNDRNQKILAKTKQLKDLDYNINELFISLQNAGLGTEDFSFEKLESSLENLSKLNGFNQFSGFAKELKKRYELKPERFMKELEQVATLWSNNQNNSTGFLSELQQISEENIEFSMELSPGGNEEEIAVKFTNELKESVDPSSLIIRSIFDQFKLAQSLGSEGYVQIPKVNYTEGLNAYTDGTMEEIKNLVVNNPSDFPRLNYDPADRSSSLAKINSAGETYDIGMYSDNPTIVGRDEQNRLILKYEKKPQYRKANSGTKQYFRDIANGKASSDRIQDPNDFLARFNSNDVKAFETSNPNTLYVSAKNLNIDPILQAEGNYIDFVIEGLNSGNTSEGIEIVEQQRNNFAPLHLINKKERAIKYSKMAKTLTEKAQKGIKGEHYQGPAHVQDNGDGSFTEYGVTYKTTVDNQIIAQVVKTTRVPSTEKGVADKILEKVELPSTNITMGQNLPLALLKMDMTFGTGDEEDLITVRRNGYDIPFVIAFEQGFIFEDPNTNIEAMDNIGK